MKQCVIVISTALYYGKWLKKNLGTRLFGEPQLWNLNYRAKPECFGTNGEKALRQTVTASLHALTFEVQRLQSAGLQVIAIAIDQTYDPTFVTGVADLSRSMGNPSVLLAKAVLDVNDPFLMIHTRVNHTFEPIEMYVPEKTAT